MAETKLADVIQPDQFTAYTVARSVEKLALFECGVLARNAVIDDQLKAGADSFTVPFWRDLGDDEANIANDDPTSKATPQKVGTGAQRVRKAFLHKSWSGMNLASELAGADAMAHVQERAAAYWSRQAQRRLVASLRGVLADNVASNGGDMVHDVSAETGTAAEFSAKAVIGAAATLGDALDGLTALAVHSAIYRQILEADLVETLPDSQGGFVQLFRGLRLVVDDGLPVEDGVYTSVLFGAGAVGYGMAEPRVSAGTEVENLPGAGNGGGQQVLHSRVNLAIHPAGFAWSDGTVAGISPTIAELADAGNWSRVVERKAVPLAFLKSK